MSSPLSRPINVALTAALLIGVASVAQAETIVVNSVADLPAALDAASPGDVIRLPRGKIEGQLVMEGISDLTFVGRRTKIDGGGDVSPLLLTNCSNLTFQRIQFQNADPHGVFAVDCQDLTFERCKVKNTDDSGMEFDDCDRITIDRCKIQRTGNDGIALSDDLLVTTDDCTISNTSISQCADDGIDLNGSRNKILNVRIKKVSGQGTDMDGGDANEFDKVKVTKSLDDGIRIEGTNTRVTNCKVVRPGADGIDLDDGGNSTVENCKVIKAGETGIELDTSGNVVRDCKIKKSGDLDIEDRIQDGSNTFIDNKFKTSDILSDEV